MVMDIGYNISSSVPSVKELPVAYEFELQNAAERLGGIGDVGGGFFDSIGNFLKGAANKIKDVASDVVGILPNVAQTAGLVTGNPALLAAGQLGQSLLGNGLMGSGLMGNGLMGNGLMGSGMMPKKKRGGCCDCGNGGSVGTLTNKQLEKRLK